MTPNNRCSALIAYGSYAPGGDNYHVFASLPGEWIKGKINTILHSPPDEIGPGEGSLVDAWMIAFSDCHAELFGPDNERQKRLLHDRWTALDAAMGISWARTQKCWWPEGREAVVHPGNMEVVNIYVPLKHFPYLAHQGDVPHPDDEDNLPKLWGEVKRGEKKYDWSNFISLLKDVKPEEFDGLFGDLPNGTVFVERLTRLFKNHMPSEECMLSNSDTTCYSYLCPLQRDALPLEQLIDLARADIAQRIAFLRARGWQSEANILTGLRYTTGTSDDAGEGEASEAMEIFDDLLRDSRADWPHWAHCLEEALYGVVANFMLQNWLMLPWSGVDIDFEPCYELWKAGGAYIFRDNTCYIYEVDR